MFRVVAIGCAVSVGAGCAHWPPEEQKAVQCAQRELTAIPGVTDVVVLYGIRPMLAYTYTNLAGRSVRSRVRIAEWEQPGKPTSYDYELVDDNWMGGSSTNAGHYDVRAIMAKCGLGQTVIMD